MVRMRGEQFAIPSCSNKRKVDGFGWVFRAVGGLHGFSSAIYLSPEHDIAVTVLSNRNLTSDKGRGDVAEIAEIILRHTLTEAHTTTPQGEPILNRSCLC